MEIFTLVTGVLYVILEIFQKKAMWIVGILTGGAAVVVFLQNRLFASAGLNMYYVIISFIGLYAWTKDSRRLSEIDNSKKSQGAINIDNPNIVQQAQIHLRYLRANVLILSVLILIAGTFGLKYLLAWLEDSQSFLDAFVTVLSAIATWWLSRSYLAQWLLWIVADALSLLLCIKGGMPWLSGMYLIYTLSAVYGYFHWKRRGLYID